MMITLTIFFFLTILFGVCAGLDSASNCDFENGCQWYSSPRSDKIVEWRRVELKSNVYTTNAVCLLMTKQITEKLASPAFTAATYSDVLKNDMKFPSNGTMYCLELEYRNLAGARVDLVITSDGAEDSLIRQVNLIKNSSAPWASVSVKFVPNTPFKLAFIGNMSLNAGMGICLDNITLTKGKCLAGKGTPAKDVKPNSDSQPDSAITTIYQQSMLDNRYIQIINKMISMENENAQFREKMLSLHQQRLDLEKNAQLLRTESNTYLKQLVNMMTAVVEKLVFNESK